MFKASYLGPYAVVVFVWDLFVFCCEFTGFRLRDFVLLCYVLG